MGAPEQSFFLEKVEVPPDCHQRDTQPLAQLFYENLTRLLKHGQYRRAADLLFVLRDFHLHWIGRGSQGGRWWLCVRHLFFLSLGSNIDRSLGSCSVSEKTKALMIIA